MCGVHGFITTETSRGQTGRAKYVYQSTIVGSLRGFDSTGLILVPHEGEGTADWVKKACDGMKFVDDKKAIERMEVGNIGKQFAVIGHNRAATVGKVTTDNAHPFVDGPITLVHNGTLTQKEEMPTGDHETIEVDSHLIAHNLANHDWKDVLENLVGAYVLIWHDARDNKVRFARNSQRPLHMMKAKDENTIFFASEADQLWWVAGRCNIKRDTIYSLDTGTMLEWEVGNLVAQPKKFEVATYRWQGKPSYGKNPYANVGYEEWAAETWGSSKSQGPRRIPGIELQEVASPASKAGKKAIHTKFGLTRHAVLDFAPSGIIPIGDTGTCILNGHAYWDPAKYTGHRSSTWECQQAIIYGVDTAKARKLMDDDWSVYPVGLRVIGQQGEQALICNVVYAETKPEEPPRAEMYAGPDNSYISGKEWLSLTTDGCCICSAQVNLGQASRCLWVDSKNICCPTCSEELQRKDRSVA